MSGHRQNPFRTTVQKPWNGDSPVNISKQWFFMVSEWCRFPSIHSIFDGHLFLGRYICRVSDDAPNMNLIQHVGMAPEQNRAGDNSAEPKKDA